MILFAAVDPDWKFLVHFPIILVVIGLVYSATRHDDLKHQDNQHQNMTDIRIILHTDKGAIERVDRFIASQHRDLVARQIEETAACSRTGCIDLEPLPGFELMRLLV